MMGLVMVVVRGENESVLEPDLYYLCCLLKCPSLVERGRVGLC